MEEKKLSEQESLELISQMIRSTRKNMEVGSGNQFLYWGYFTAALSVLLFLLVYYTGDARWSIGWFSMFLFWGFMLRMQRKETPSVINVYRPCHSAGLESDRQPVCADRSHHVFAGIPLRRSHFFLDATPFSAL